MTTSGVRFPAAAWPQSGLESVLRMSMVPTKVDGQEVSEMSEADVGRIIGQRYVNGRFPSEDHPYIEEAYKQIAERNRIMYDEIPVPVLWTYEDPYEDFTDMKVKVEAHDEFEVFAGGSHPKYLSEEDNVKGRAVHDWFGHLRHDVNFSIEGEFRKWWHTRHHYPPIEQTEGKVPVRKVLFAEIVGQRCAAEVLPDGFSSDRFEQRAIAAPDEWIELCRQVFLDEAERQEP